MADWGLYSALRGTNNWEQRRNDKMVNLQIIEKQNQEARLKQQESVRIEEEINNYFDQMSNMDVLPEDQERIKALEKEKRSSVVKGIAENNGDLSRYMSSGGVTDLHDYRNSIIQSKEVKTALSNKANLQSYLTDSAKGDRFFNKVDVSIPKLDEDGNSILDENGKPLSDYRKMTFQQQMSLFKSGKIKSINYNGSEKKVKLNPFIFMQRPKDPSKPFSRDNIVTASNVKFQAMEMGASENYANELAKSYVKMVKSGGDSWKWGNKSEEERIALLTNLQAKQQALLKRNGVPQKYKNRYKNALTGKGHNPISGNSPEWRNSDGTIGGKNHTSHSVSSDELSHLSNALGLDFRKLDGTEIYENLENKDLINAEDIANPNLISNTRIYSPRSGEETNLDGIKYSVTAVKPKVHRIDGKSFLEATIYTNEEGVEKMGIRSEKGFDHITDSWKGLVQDVGGGGMTGDNYMITSFIPLNDSPAAQDAFSKKMVAAKFKEDSGIERTGDGEGQESEQLRDYFRK